MAENNVQLFANFTKLSRSRHSEFTLESTTKAKLFKGNFYGTQMDKQQMVINFGTVVKVRARNTYLCLAFV